MRTNGRFWSRRASGHGMRPLRYRTVDTFLDHRRRGVHHEPLAAITRDSPATLHVFLVTIPGDGENSGPMESVRFTDFTMLRNARRLMREGMDVAVGARAFDLLDLLVAARDRVVSRDEIMATVWPGTVVGENNLNVQVANLRRILGADAIVTVPGRGLAFALDVLPVDAELALPDRPSVVVLPFETLMGPSDLDWLADGFVEDITTELSRFR